jgi:hypothetical protein
LTALRGDSREGRVIRRCATFLSIFLAALAYPAVGADKSQYDLFHPTPSDLMRSFSADRPSQSTGPYTVDAGHFYFETSVLSYFFDEPDNHTTVQQWNPFSFNLRAGLTNNVELDLVYGGYSNFLVRDRAAGGTKTNSGFGDFVLQSKINLFGNDGGPTALGLIPFLKFPTNTHDLGNDSIEGGLGIPLQIALPGNFSLGLESGASFVRNSGDTGYDPGFFNAIVLGHTLFIDPLTIYGELFSLITAGADSTLAAYIDTGLVYQVFPNADVDFGCNFGVTDAANDYEPFTGFSFRF